MIHSINVIILHRIIEYNIVNYYISKQNKNSTKKIKHNCACL